MIKEWICDLRNFFLTPLVQSSGHWGQFQGTCGFVDDLYSVAQFLFLNLTFLAFWMSPLWFSWCPNASFSPKERHFRCFSSSYASGGIRMGVEWLCEPQRGRICACRPLSKTGGPPGCSPQPLHWPGQSWSKPAVSFLASISSSCGPH